VHFDQDSLWVELERRQNHLRAAGLVSPASPFHAEQRERVRISSRGLHWEALDEDISIAGLLAGESDLTQGRQTFAA